MPHKNKTLAGLSALAAVGALIAAPAAAQDQAPTDAGLSAAALSDGQTNRAINALTAELESHPGDPALLINLGIAQAQSGLTQDARVSFEAAMRSREVVELETANGRVTDSRRLARRAIAMLDRGEFGSQRATGRQLTLRD